MYRKYVKRFLDIILAIIAIVITLPIFLLTGILVLIFLGKPAIFRQKRPGKDEKIFTMYKFRTMTKGKNRNGEMLPDELVPFSKDTFVTKEHDSLKISNGFWYWFSKGIGGKSALDYLIKVKAMSFIDAMKEVIGCSKSEIKYDYKQKKKKDIELQLPEKNDNNDKVISYLISRGIDKDIIDECISKELIYKSKDKHNIVFIGFDKNYKARFACERGTNSSRYMHDCYGSNKAFSFKLTDKNQLSDSVHLFESAIDLLSYATILKKIIVIFI